MDRDSKALVKELKDAGLSDHAINAAWPTWWDDAAASSPSARAELRFALSRKLGLSPQSLLGERVEFVWQDEARFKNLTAGDAFQRGGSRIVRRCRRTPASPGHAGGAVIGRHRGLRIA